MKTMHLFAGIGGGILGDLILGHEPIIAVEWDKYACRVLRERVADGWFPGMQVYEGDVRMFNPSEYAGRVDCIHAGFPCQDISNAGKQAGVGEETRSGLYREVLRIADVVRPQYIFMENVSAILSNGLGTVLGDLASRGYDARWICIRASDVGANHQRDRWWLLAKLENTDNKRLSQCKFPSVSVKSEFNNWTNDENMVNPKNERYLQCSYEGKQQRNSARCSEREFTGRSEDVAYAGSGRQPGQGEYVGCVNSTQDSDREADRTIYGREARQGWWEFEPELGRVAYGVPDRVGQLKGYGNAQVPLQAATAFRILEAML